MFELIKLFATSYM